MIMKKIFIFELLFIAILLLCTSLTSAEEVKKSPLGIITGEKVNMRDKPGTEGKITYQFLKGEIVLYEASSEKETRIGDYVYSWYKVKTQYPWRKKCIRKGWQEIYKRNPTRLEGWVYGKYFKLLDGEISKEDRILKEIIDQKFNGQLDNLTTLVYNPTLLIQTIHRKEYYIFAIQSQDYSDDCQGNDHSGVYIKDFIHDKYKELIGKTISEYKNPFNIYDLDNDGFAEIFVSSLNKGISVYSEKRDKNIFEFNFYKLDGEEFSKFYKNSYIKLVEGDLKGEMKIIAFWINDQKVLVKKVTYEWDGDNYVEGEK